MSKSNGLPEHIDAPNANYFAYGSPVRETPFEGSNELIILRQDFCSISGVFPTFGDTHPEQGNFKLIHKTPEEPLGGGLTKANCIYASIGSEITKKIRQSVNFYGVRNRQINYKENYGDTIRSSRNEQTSIGGTFFSYPVVSVKQITRQRTLEAYDIVAREPFSEECICILHTKFYNTAITPVDDIKIQEKLLVKDTNTSNWKRSIEESYESSKHERSTGFNMPEIPTHFTDSVGTNYLSETSTPSAIWYAGKVGDDDYIVSPTNIEPYYAGTLVKVDWITTQYR